MKEVDFPVSLGWAGSTPTAVGFKSPSGQSCSVMSSKFFAESVSRKTFAVPKHDSICLLFFSRSMPQLFGSGFDDAPWHGHKIITADVSQDDASQDHAIVHAAVCQHLFQCRTSTQLPRHQQKNISTVLVADPEHRIASLPVLHWFGYELCVPPHRHGELKTS